MRSEVGVRDSIRQSRTACKISRIFYVGRKREAGMPGEAECRFVDSVHIIVWSPQKVFGYPGRRSGNMNADSDPVKRRVIDVAVVIIEAARFPGLGQHSGIDILDTLPGGKAVAHSHILSRDGIASADITRELIVANGALLGHMDRVSVGARTSRRADRSQGIVLERGNTMRRALLVQEMEQQLGTTLPGDHADRLNPRVTGAGISPGERRGPAASLSLGFVRFDGDADECLPGAIADVSPAVAGLSGVTGGTAPSLDLRMHRPVPGGIGTCSIRDRRWALE